MHIRAIVGLVVVLILPVCYSLTEVQFTKQCIEEYKTILANFNSEQGTCLRLQIFMDCLSKRPGIRGQMVDAMRYFFTQQAIFVAKLNFCPKIDFKDIKLITDQTDFAKNDKYLDTINFDMVEDQCAIDIHMKCVKEYVMMFSKQRKICDDVTSWITCYAREANRIGCKAQIVTAFSKMLDSVGNLVIREIRRFAGIECLKMEL